ECWGHRGASARFPENTMASFEAAIRDGVDGIESDVHVSADGIILMFQDQALQRTTNFKGTIKDCNWYGVDGMEHARTKKEPKQSIPTFVETLSLLMKVCARTSFRMKFTLYTKPENLHVHLNVDIKATNDPDKLFPLMHAAISAYPQWETLLAPRILLGMSPPSYSIQKTTKEPWCDIAVEDSSIQLSHCGHRSSGASSACSR
ncbi:PLC-like phosphodiesterase, partial [Mycena filopes]